MQQERYTEHDFKGYEQWPKDWGGQWDDDDCRKKMEYYKKYWVGKKIPRTPGVQVDTNSWDDRHAMLKFTLGNFTF